MYSSHHPIKLETREHLDAHLKKTATSETLVATDFVFVEGFTLHVSLSAKAIWLKPLSGYLQLMQLVHIFASALLDIARPIRATISVRHAFLFHSANVMPLNKGISFG